MINREELTKIGRIKKVHGVKGEMLFEFTDDSFEGNECEFLIFNLDGIFVPFRLTDYRFISHSSALITLKRVAAGEEARPFVGKDVYFPQKQIVADTSEDLFSWDYFRGFVLIDEKYGKIGEIKEIDETTINVLFQVESESEDYLIPANDEFITHINPDQKELFVILPDGILNL